MRIERMERMISRGRLAALLALPMLLLACATPDRVVLLPQEDGSPSAVLVQHRDGREVLLNQAYATASVSERRLEAGVSSAEEVKARYPALSDALPARARSYLLYFQSGGEQLTAESVRRLDEVLAEIKQLPAPELMIIGHTDSVGSEAANDDISLRRARAIRASFVGKGFDAASIEAVGRGKRQLLVPTADGVAEPKNRRVEIRLR